MCLFNTPKAKDPVLPTETQAMRAPDGGEVRSSTSRRTMDRMRAGSQTVLTSGSGAALTGQVGKTLLGQ